MGKKITSAMFAMALAGATTTGNSSPAQASSLMTACSPDIASLCKGVREGRGRISACLFAHGNRISPACKPEVTKVAKRMAFEPKVPAGARSGTVRVDEAKLKQVCASDIRTHCRSVTPGKGRLLACIYAWSNNVSTTCRSEARAMIEDMR